MATVPSSNPMEIWSFLKCKTWNTFSSEQQTTLDFLFQASIVLKLMLVLLMICIKTNRISPKPAIEMLSGVAHVRAWFKLYSPGTHWYRLSSSYHMKNKDEFPPFSFLQVIVEGRGAHRNLMVTTSEPTSYFHCSF